jgi:hypothetical protein
MLVVLVARVQATLVHTVQLKVLLVAVLVRHHQVVAVVQVLPVQVGVTVVLVTVALVQVHQTL